MRQKTKLLTEQEIAACKKIALQDDLNGKRAKALLALNEGATQINAGEQSGLTKQQVIYWIRVFRQKRLDAFVSKPESKAAPVVEKSVKAIKPPETEKVVKKKKKKDKKKVKKDKQAKKKKDKKKKDKKKKKSKKKK